MSLIVLVPTRARPDNAARLSGYLDKENVEHVFCVDQDDPELNGYEALGANLIIGRPNRLGPWLNIASKLYLDTHDVIGFVGDDVIPRTAGWADKVEGAMTTDGLVYCNDGWQGRGLPTSVFMDSQLIRRIGYMVYPELIHLYIDNHWKALGEHLGTLTYLDDVYLEHMHPYAGKAEEDETYRAANSAERYSKDKKAFDRFVERELKNI